MFLTQIKAVLFDKNIIAFWPARGFQMMLSNLFGIILQSLNYSLQDILFSWASLYLGGGLIFILADMFIVKYKMKTLLVCFFGGLVLCLNLIFSNEITLIPLIGFLIFCQPLFREIIQTTIIYIREKEHTMNSDIATSILNEAARLSGSIMILLFGLIISYFQGFLIYFLFIVFLTLSIGLFYNLKNNDHYFNASLSKSMSKYWMCFIVLSFIHYGLVFAVQSLLSLSMVAMFQSAGIGKSAISLTSGLLSLVIIFVMMFNHFLSKNKSIKDDMMPLSLLNKSVIFIALSILLITSLLYMLDINILSPISAAIVIAMSIGLLQSFCNLFFIGSLQLLDFIVAKEKDIVLDKRHLLNMNLKINSFSPGCILGLFAWFSNGYDIQSIQLDIFFTITLSYFLLSIAFIYFVNKVKKIK
jgi:hypothetical protein